MLSALGSASLTMRSALGSASLLLAHGPSALWKKAGKDLLLCEHNAGPYPPFSALLFAFVYIITQKNTLARVFYIKLLTGLKLVYFSLR